MNIKALLLFFAAGTGINTAAAVTFPLPETGNRVVGTTEYQQIPAGSKQPLEAFAAKHHVGMSNMMDANPGVDIYLPPPGTVLTFPLQSILPDTVHEGIVINTAEMRLYYYPKGQNSVEIYPVGIGQIGHDTPEHWVTYVRQKKVGPTWTPTPNERTEFAAEGDILPAVVPAGPDNPMGLYAMYIGNQFAIHGTNADFGIGLRVSHGCVRLRADDLKKLFSEVPVGTRVEFINQPVKATIEKNGARYIEVHNQLSESEKDATATPSAPAVIPDSLLPVVNDPQVQKNTLRQALAMHAGMPVRLN